MIELDGHRIEITHPDRLLFPADGSRKAEFVDYYRRIAPRMLPHLKGRPLAMERYQQGIAQEGFFQQNIPDYAPDWIDRVTVPKEGGAVTHIICNNAATLVYLANQDCVVFHTWQSRLPALDKPDRLIFDLDPSGTDFSLVREGARLLHRLLAERGLTAYLKSTGSRGVHVIVPIPGEATFAEARARAAQIAASVVESDPAKYTVEHLIEKRAGRLYIDVLRNSYGHLAVAPYSVRALPGAPVAAPLAWHELDDPAWTARKYTLRSNLPIVRLPASV